MNWICETITVFLGLIHIAQTITQHTSIDHLLNQPFDMECYVDEYKPTQRGIEVSVMMKVSLLLLENLKQNPGIRQLVQVEVYVYSHPMSLCFLAHLWGAYAIPVALSVVRRLVVRRVSSVSTITTRNN